jgi:hypothetical protein
MDSFGQLSYDLGVWPFFACEFRKVTPFKESIHGSHQVTMVKVIFIPVYVMTGQV